MNFNKINWTYHSEEEGSNPAIRSWEEEVTETISKVTIKVVVYELLSGDIFMKITSEGKSAQFYPNNEEEILIIVNCFMYFAK
jgi:hypothetical protein